MTSQCRHSNPHPPPPPPRFPPLPLALGGGAAGGGGAARVTWWRRPRGGGRCLHMHVTAAALGRRLLSMATPPPPVPTAVPSDPGDLSAAFVTCPNETVAKELARAMVEKRLAACVNILPHVTSIYSWQGKLEEDGEVLLMIKTRSSRVPALAAFVRSAHPYEVPEVVAVPVTQGNPPYLQWVRDSTDP
ncbi:divalent-cation tolerance protein CutA-like isoform X2 [Patagioenas fasciata]|uniref:divalent-cation tolerance protein CutA-like isoform X2 n=1 Tax=Patagioenas fasciata TaxID=372321 RepID=UPI003A9A509F